ncbi:MAG: magnesium chelatase domain-containing protein, partial [Rhodothermales bacterium]|nr:magnesium chelatase domain-containing protein [Rhodothermales bacterium]
MLSHVWSSTVLGVDALPIEIETHVEPGLPKWTVVGLPDGAVRESRDRVWAALKNTGLAPPRGAVTVNLAPADVRKEGAAFDLPIALGLLAASGHPVALERLEDLFVLGEVALDGALRPVRGVLPMAIRARAEGKRGVIVPEENAPEAAVVEGLEVYGVRSLRDAVALLTDGAEPFRRDLGALLDAAHTYPIDFAEVRGQEGTKRAL